MTRFGRNDLSGDFHLLHVDSVRVATSVGGKRQIRRPHRPRDVDNGIIILPELPQGVVVHQKQVN